MHSFTRHLEADCQIQEASSFCSSIKDAVLYLKMPHHISLQACARNFIQMMNTQPQAYLSSLNTVIHVLSDTYNQGGCDTGKHMPVRDGSNMMFIIRLIGNHTLAKKQASLLQCPRDSRQEDFLALAQQKAPSTELHKHSGQSLSSRIDNRKAWRRWYFEAQQQVLLRLLLSSECQELPCV